jgi:hemerythrin superfamily protein
MPTINFQTIKNAILSLLGQAKGEDAIDMLIADHRRVKQIFDSFEDMDEERKIEAVHKALVELALHAAVEEKLVYPLIREVGENEGMNESKEEHHVMKFLMSELEAMHEASEELDAKFKVLSEIVLHHVQEEENEYFPALREKGDTDLRELGEEITAKKEELLKKLGDESDLAIIDPELRVQRNGHNGLDGQSANANGTKHPVNVNGNGNSNNQSQSRKAPTRKVPTTRKSVTSRGTASRSTKAKASTKAEARTEMTKASAGHKLQSTKMSGALSKGAAKGAKKSTKSAPKATKTRATASIQTKKSADSADNAKKAASGSRPSQGRSGKSQRKGNSRSN